MTYLAIKAFHIMSLISWFAVLFYLPRLFVYHAEHRDNSEFVKVVKIMERKLFRYIGIPAFWATLLSGLAMIALNPGLLTGTGWLHAKLTLIAVLIIYFFHAGRLLQALANDTDCHSGKFFRVYNEIPTLLMIAIVILAVIKPF
ncbi:MAG: protoporphyrinogen oxidase HemJ [Campylobacterales bacterium]